jgi:hypothetical protein
LSVNISAVDNVGNDSVDITFNGGSTFAQTLGRNNAMNSNGILVNVPLGNPEYIGTGGRTPTAATAQIKFTNGADEIFIQPSTTYSSSIIDITAGTTGSKVVPNSSIRVVADASWMEHRGFDSYFYVDVTGAYMFSGAELNLIAGGGANLNKIKIGDGAFGGSKYTMDFGAIGGNYTATWQQSSGIVAWKSDINPDQNLASVLAVGNTTGANDIVVTTGQAITSDNVTPAFTAPPLIYNGSGIYGDTNGLFLFWATAGNIAAQVNYNASGIDTLVSTGDDISWGTIGGTATFTINNDITFRIQDGASGFYTSFDAGLLSANHTLTTPDKSGVIAVVNDIPTITWANVLSTGAESGSTSPIISTNAGAQLRFFRNTFYGSVNPLPLTADREYRFPDDDGTIALTKNYETNKDWSNITSGNLDRSYDADATTVDELADVLYTLITDLRNTLILD